LFIISSQKFHHLLSSTTCSSHWIAAYSAPPISTIKSSSPLTAYPIYSLQNSPAQPNHGGIQPKQSHHFLGSTSTMPPNQNPFHREVSWWDNHPPVATACSLKK
jgi:hypothetical protein